MDCPYLPRCTGISEGAPATFAEDCTTQGQGGLKSGERVVIKPDQGVRAQTSEVQTSVSASRQKLEGRCADAECLIAVQ